MILALKYTQHVIIHMASTEELLFQHFRSVTTPQMYLKLSHKNLGTWFHPSGVSCASKNSSDDKA